MVDPILSYDFPVYPGKEGGPLAVSIVGVQQEEGVVLPVSGPLTSVELQDLMPLPVSGPLTNTELESLLPLDVALGTAITGIGNPPINYFSSITVELPLTADITAISAPGLAKQIWIYGLFVIAKTSNGTITLRDTDDKTYLNWVGVNTLNGIVLPLSGNFSMPWLKLDYNTGLVVETDDCSGTILVIYGIISL